VRLRIGSVFDGARGVVEVEFCGEGVQACLCPASRWIFHMSRHARPSCRERSLDPDQRQSARELTVMIIA
jgi:hypothetical protein